MAAWSGDTPAEMVSLCEGLRGQLRECQRYFGREKSMSGCQQLGKYVRSFRESPTQHVHVLDFVGGRKAKVKASWKRRSLWDMPRESPAWTAASSSAWSITDAADDWQFSSGLCGSLKGFSEA